MDIEAAKAKHRNFLRSLPNVVGVGLGPKLCAGKPTGETAVKVFVSRKVSVDELREEDRVPPTLEGFPTDVEVLDSLTAK